MRLTLTLPELERGHSVQTGPKERIQTLRWAAEHQDPVAIIPITTHDHRIISVVLLTTALNLQDTSCSLTFRPIWNKTFTLCSSNKDSVLALICEFEIGQYWIDRSGHRRCKLTLGGNGTDPKAVHNSVFALAELLAAPERPPVLAQAIEFIRKNL